MTSHATDYPKCDSPPPEFPEIRIDRFRTLSDRPAPTACFLSHVHTDHLVGLDVLKSPFLYCSPATREMLLKLEKYPHRLNFNKGIAEVVRRDYRHLNRLLKPIPLETPTRIELKPGKSVTVTLFDANHCLGAVSFLIEGDDAAVIYTGDIRAEPWLMQSWARHPKLVPYIPQPQGPGLRRLSAVYLDTTFAVTSHVYAEFPTKAKGLAELLAAVQRYPKDTVFYMHAWTFGYEDVWRALSGFLDSPVHLDRYRYGVYTSISNSCGPGLETPDAALFCGHGVGNKTQKGILTRDEGARLHSCEQGSGCPILGVEPSRPVVSIKPVVSRSETGVIAEVGLGGGKGDLDQLHQVNIADRQAVEQLKLLCQKHIGSPASREKAIEFLDDHLSRGCADLALTHEQVLGIANDDNQDLQLTDLVNMLATMPPHGPSEESAPSSLTANDHGKDQALPSEIVFPYARHSCYSELRELVALFHPREVVPCTAPQLEHYDRDKSMETFFGDCCIGEGFIADELNTAPRFTWDASMQRAQEELAKQGQLPQNPGSSQAAQETAPRIEEDSIDDENLSLRSSPPLPLRESQTNVPHAPPSQTAKRPAPENDSQARSVLDDSQSGENKRPRVQAALDAALAGEWHTVGLKCTDIRQGSPVDDDDEWNSWL